MVADQLAKDVKSFVMIAGRLESLPAKPQCIVGELGSLMENIRLQHRCRTDKIILLKPNTRPQKLSQSTSLLISKSRLEIGNERLSR